MPLQLYTKFFSLSLLHFRKILQITLWKSLERIIFQVSIVRMIETVINRLKCHIKKCILILLGSAILAFGLYHVHSFSNITEGGVLGLTLLLHYWLHLSPAISGFVLNALCYFLGYKTLGKKFIAYSIVAGSGFSFFYAIFEQFDPLWPQLAQMPLAAAITGALFVGTGVGISARYGGAPGGDDALAMSLGHLFKVNIKWIYLISDLVVLVLSVSYIPLNKIVYSLLTVILSGQIIGLFQLGKDKA